MEEEWRREEGLAVVEERESERSEVVGSKELWR